MIELYKPEIIKNGSGYSNHDQSFGISEDANGNLYQTGYFEGEINFGNTKLISVGNYDIFVAKINKNGGWDWAVSVGGTSFDLGKDLAFDNSGNIYLTGYYFGTCYFGNFSISAIANSDVFVAKLSSTGEWLWAKSAGGTGFNKSNGIACDNAGNVYVSGSFESKINFGDNSLTSSGLRDIFVAKISSSGNWLWQIKAGGNSADEAMGIKYNSNNNFIAITGYFSSNSTFGNTSISSIGNRDIFISQIDTASNWIWTKAVGTTGIEESRALALDAAGSALITGVYTNSITFGSNNLPAASAKDVFVSKIDKNGNWVWARNATGNEDDEANSIGLDNSGNGYIVGSFYNNIKFGNSELTSTNDRNLFVARITSSGNWSWGRLISGTSTIDGNGISVASNGVSFISGSIYDKAYAVNDTLQSKGESDILTARIASSGQWAWSQSNGGVTGIINGLDITTDKNGRVISTGSFYGTIKFGADTLLSKGKKDFFVAVSTKEGNFLKATSFGSNNNDESNSVSTDLNGNIYITGYFEGDFKFANSNLTTNGLSDIFIAKLNSSLEPVWIKTIGDTDFDIGKKIIADSIFLYVTGTYEKKPYFADTRLNARGQLDVFLTKLDLNGNYIWTISMGGTQRESINNMALDKSKNVLLTGGFESVCSWGSISISAYGGDDIFIAKANKDGQWIWALKAGSSNFQENGCGVDVDNNNNIYLAGIFRGLSLFGSEYLLSNGGTDIFISKLDSNGTWIWSKSFGGSSTDFVNDLKFINNAVQVSGTVSSSFSYSDFLFKSNSNIKNAFLANFLPDGNINWLISDNNSGQSEIFSIFGDETNTLLTGKYISNLKFGNKSLNDNSFVDNNMFIGYSGFTLEKPSWTFRDSTGFPAYVKIPKDINPFVNGRALIKGDAVGLFYIRNSNYYCAGMGYWNNEDLEITCWGDDLNTPTKDGFSINEKFNFIVWDALKAEEVVSKVRYFSGPENFMKDSISILQQLPKKFDSLNVFLKQGWNMVSININPEFPRMDSIFKDIKSSISLVKSSSGSTYIPSFGINSIGNWTLTQGYQVFAQKDINLSVLGDFISPSDITYNLNSGWHIISYLRNSPKNIVNCLSALVQTQKLLLVKNSEGKTYIPSFNINGIGNMLPTQGYQIYLNGSVQFTYPAND